MKNEKKDIIIVLIIIGSIICLWGLFVIILFGGLLYIAVKDAQFNETDADKVKIEQYLEETYNYQFELVSYEIYSSTGFGTYLEAIYKYDDIDFSIVMNKGRTIIRDNFASNYWFSRDEEIKENDVIPNSLKELSSLSYYPNIEYEDDFLDKYKKDFKNVDLNKIVENEKEFLTLEYHTTIILKDESVDYYKEDIFDLYKTMEQTGVGKISILIYFNDNKGNFIDSFSFIKINNSKIDSKQDLEEFYNSNSNN